MAEQPNTLVPLYFEGIPWTFTSEQLQTWLGRNGMPCTYAYLFSRQVEVDPGDFLEIPLGSGIVFMENLEAQAALLNLSRNLALIIAPRIFSTVSVATDQKLIQETYDDLQWEEQSDAHVDIRRNRDAMLQRNRVQYNLNRARQEEDRIRARQIALREAQDEAQNQERAEVEAEGQEESEKTVEVQKGDGEDKGDSGHDGSKGEAEAQKVIDKEAKSLEEDIAPLQPTSKFIDDELSLLTGLIRDFGYGTDEKNWMGLTVEQLRVVREAAEDPNSVATINNKKLWEPIATPIEPIPGPSGISMKPLLTSTIVTNPASVASCTSVSPPASGSIESIDNLIILEDESSSS